MEKRKIVKLWNVLTDIMVEKEEKLNVYLAYCLAKNKKILEPEVEILKSLLKYSPGMEEFERKRIGLVQRYGEKDDNGKPKIENNSFVILPENAEKFENEVNQLREEYSYYIEEQEKRKKEFDALMETNTDLDLIKIPMDCLPEKINPSIMELFVECDIIKE